MLALKFSIRVRPRFNGQFRSYCPATPHNAIASKHFGFLGSGKMAQALVNGFLKSGTLTGKQVTMTDQFDQSPADAHFFEPIGQLEAKFGLEYLQCNKTMAQKSDIIFCCLKPHIMIPVLTELSNKISGKLVISVAAGVTLDQLKQATATNTRLIRVMPNTPCLVEHGTGVFSRDPLVSDEDIAILEALCRPVFSVFEEIPETLMNAAGAVCGSGPAYVFVIAEALADGGVRMGLPRTIAQKLATNTIIGAATMLQQTGKDPTELKNDVCSPGGSTIAGIHALEQGNLRAVLMNAVKAATERGQELGA